MEHFFLSLKRELTRMERTEQPLGLIVVRAPDSYSGGLRALGSFFNHNLKPLEVAARLSESEAAVLFPEADVKRIVWLLKALEKDFDNRAEPLGSPPGFGVILVRPLDGLEAGKIVALAREKIRSAAEAVDEMSRGDWARVEINTSLAAAEKESLFRGFNSLSSFIWSGASSRNS
jgi:hypothetical protein